MGGSKTITYSALQVQKIMDEPEKAYKAAMRQAYKNIGSGMRSVIREYQQGIIDTRSMFNDSYLTNLGYNPKEVILYTIVDPVLVRSWLLSNVNSNIGNVLSYKWTVPSLEEIALEYLQDTYSGMLLTEKSFLIGSVRWYVSGVTNVSTYMTNATCYKDRLVTAQEYAVSVGLVVAGVEDRIYTIRGVNYWQVAMTNGSVVDVPVQYTTIACPGVSSDVVQAVIAEYNGKEHIVHSKEVSTDSETGITTPFWTNTITISVYVDNDGSIKVVGRAAKPESKLLFNSSTYLESTKEAVTNTVEIVRTAIDASIVDSLDRLIVVYELNGVQKLKLAEINKELVSNTSNASSYPVIPLRKGYEFVKETRQMKAILNKLGMATDNFESSLDNNKIKTAAIMFLLDLRDSSEVGTKVVYETLVNMVRTTIPASGKIAEAEGYQLNLKFSDVKMKSRIRFDLKTVSGVIGSVGSYVRYKRTAEYQEWVDIGDQQYYVTSTGTIYGIRKQLSESYYEEMEFGDCRTDWEVGGYEIRGELSLANTEGEVYIPITDLGLDGLRYEDLHYAVARSMSMMALSVVKVKTKWYQSGFFKFVIAAVLMVTQQWWALVIFIVSESGLISGKVAIVLSLFTMDFSGLAQIAQGATVTGTTVLSAATALVQLASMAISVNTLGIVEAIEDKRANMNAETEASEKQIKDMNAAMQEGLWMGIQDRTPDMLYAMSSTDMMCNYSILYDYDGMYEGKIRSVGI